MTHHDFRSLCVELLTEVKALNDVIGQQGQADLTLIPRALAALAAEPQEGVISDEELDRIYYNLSPAEIDRCWRDYARAIIARYAPTPAPVAVAIHIDRWHEDHGPRLWWRFPIEEPPYAGTPLDSDWPGYHTHFTRIDVPALPLPEVQP